MPKGDVLVNVLLYTLVHLRVYVCLYIRNLQDFIDVVLECYYYYYYYLRI